MKTPLVLCLFAAALTAQKVPLPEQPERIVQVFDVEKLLPGPVQPGLRLPVPGNRAGEHDALQALVGALARFVDPPLAADDDLKPLGTRRLVLLGSPQQSASLERMLRTASERSTQLIDVQMQFVLVADKVFQANLNQRLPAVERGQSVTRELVADRTTGDELQTFIAKIGGERLDAPTLTVRPLQPAQMSAMTQTAYVKDFTITKKGTDVIADPVVDVVRDGTEADVCATFLPDGTLGVSCSVTLADLKKSIATFETKIGAPGTPVTIQLPEVTTTRLHQTAALQDGGLVVLASRKADGNWLVTLVRAQSQPR